MPAVFGVAPEARSMHSAMPVIGLRGAALGAALGSGVQTFGRSGRVTVCRTGAASG
jgi:hypothetical protein